MTKFMKRFLMALMAVVFIGMASCSKDDDPAPVPDPDPIPDIIPTPEEKGIYGTWLWTTSSIDEGLLVTESMALTLNRDHTGTVSITETVESRAALSTTVTEYFSWTNDKDSDNWTYISFIHTGGDTIFGNSKYYYTQAADALSIGDMTFLRQ